MNDNNRESKKKNIACFECEPRVPREKKALSSMFILKAQYVEFVSTMQQLDETDGISFYC